MRDFYKRFKAKIKSQYINNQKGESLVSYPMIVALIGIVSFSSIKYLGREAGDVFCDASIYVIRAGTDEIANFDDDEFFLNDNNECSYLAGSEVLIPDSGEPILGESL